MDTMSAFAMGMASRGKATMVFDWDKAAKLISERKPLVASAGLAGDWEYTGGSIYRDGKPVPRENTYTYLASTWATPELDLDGDVIPCWKFWDDTPNWHSDTYWPESALKILNESSLPVADEIVDG
jgi:hypothetical protein